nr:polymer-forming cytoskeletal protein [Halomonas socia]
MGGGDALFIAGVVALILIMLDGKRRMRKRAVANQASPPHASPQHQLAPPVEPATPSLQAEQPAKASLPTVPLVAPTQRLSAPDGSLIGETLRIAGKVHARQPLVIHGTIEGDIEAPEQPVTITETGGVSRRIEARLVSVAGRVEGLLVATDQAILLPSARVSGSIEAKRMKCAKGAWLTAKVRVTSH